MEPKASLSDDLVPNGDENVQIQGSSELASHRAFEVAADLVGYQPIRHLHDQTAEDDEFVTLEDANPLLVLHLRQRRLIPCRLHQGEAVQRVGRKVVRELMRVVEGRHDQSRAPDIHPASEARNDAGLAAPHGLFRWEERLEETHIGEAVRVPLGAPRPSAAPLVRVASLPAHLCRGDMLHAVQGGLCRKVNIDLGLRAQGHHLGL
mmetsp:Transcript_57242/g.112695  ORF Transcript_57242/g.112695 Transcript_57242/m.112695 type:complete len:206 (+) Transcript_57242:503-1120(+)